MFLMHCVFVILGYITGVEWLDHVEYGFKIAYIEQLLCFISQKLQQGVLAM